MTQKLPGLISVHQLHRLSVHLRYFQTSRFPYIQIVRTSQLFSVQQFSSYTGCKNLSVNTSPAVVQQASISGYQLFSDKIPDIFRVSENFRITVCQIIRTSVFFSNFQCTSFSDSQTISIFQCTGFSDHQTIRPSVVFSLPASQMVSQSVAFSIPAPQTIRSSVVSGYQLA